MYRVLALVVGLALLIVWIIFCIAAPHTAVQIVFAGVGGWQVGKWISQIAEHIWSIE